jgi:hypothetical protein
LSFHACVFRLTFRLKRQLQADNFIATVLNELYHIRHEEFTLSEVYSENDVLLKSSYFLFSFSRQLTLILDNVTKTIMDLVCRFEALRFKDECKGISYRHFLDGGEFYVSDKILLLIPSENATTATIRLEVTDPFVKQLLLLIGIYH